MKIKEILPDDCYLRGDAQAEISGIAYDSRMVKPGDLFVAVSGENSDGHNFIEDSIKKGATAVVHEMKKSDDCLVDKYPNIAWIGVIKSRDAIAELSSRFYGNPSARLTLIGITGTNGKTTTSYIIKNMLERCGNDVGLIGTIGCLIKDRFFDAIHTTPEAPDFQYYLRRMADEGCNYAVSEVSSHALSQKRVDYSGFKIAVFTNLTHDHLDFHKTMEEYYNAKKRLFTELLIKGGTAVINIDDTYGERLLNEIKREKGASVKCLTLAIKNPNADLRALNIKATFKGISFKLRYSGWAGDDFEETIQSSLIGMPNVYNLLSGIAAALSLGLPVDLIKRAISEVRTVEGRFQQIDAGQDFLALVDYAHTDDALAGLLDTARQLVRVEHSSVEKVSCDPKSVSTKNGKIITVFGCGGNRDRSKRPKMADVATRLSNFVIMTTDNPRFEDPMDIIRDMEKGAVNGNYMIVPDRRLAIQMAVEIASRGDIVIAAGKGHEDYQEIKGVRMRFSDKAELENAVIMKKGC